jgi:hypothetical protein
MLLPACKQDRHAEGWQSACDQREAGQAADGQGRHAKGTFEAETGGLNLEAWLHVLAGPATAAAARQPESTFSQFLGICPHLQAVSQQAGTW